MKPVEHRACICGCNALLKRRKSMLLCPAAQARLFAIYREQSKGKTGPEQIRLWNSIFKTEASARAALEADRCQMAEAV